MNFHLVLTTINNPLLLKDYARHAAAFKKGKIAFTVAGDKKTPPEAASLCGELEKEYGFPIRYMGVQEQNDFLKPWPEFDVYLPWNCIQRRNVAMLYAYRQGADVIITIDDDNFIATEDYFGPYAFVGQEQALPTVRTSSGWFNICQFLEDEEKRLYFPRGYPINNRLHAKDDMKMESETGRVVVNGGLWLGDPDIDAATRLALPINAVSYNLKTNFALAPKTWSPFNSQNTGLHRDCMPAYFLSPAIGRYDDIWASYMVVRLAEQFNDRIAFGEPLVKQERNPHNLYHDFDKERLGMQVTDVFCEWLRAIPITATSYREGCRQLVNGLKEKLRTLPKSMDEAQRNYLQGFIQGYQHWLDLDLWDKT